jgi:hypothetical protein
VCLQTLTGGLWQAINTRLQGLVAMSPSDERYIKEREGAEIYGLDDVHTFLR